MAHKQDVLELLVGDHRETERMFAAFEASRDPVRRRELVDLVVAGLERHSAAEEEHLYPVVRRVLPDGDEIAARELAEHAEVGRTIDALDGADPTDTAFARDVATLMRQVQEHVVEEENEVFPRLRAALTPGERAELGARAMDPGAGATGPRAGLADRVRAWLTGRTHLM
ncbi:hemerythrin domain-containing protein [Streptomyces albiaxialis]|uniref:Hemerythrin domain-containing protein n=1 Tax=Streptomyces albiaxialis TaxID=329523 RepID=A0ABP5HNL0_9ACTN